MDLMTPTLAGLVTKQTIPAFGPYSASAVSLDTVLDQIVSSTAPIAQAANGHGDPRSVAELISDRLGIGFGSATVTLFISRHRMTAVSGVVVGVNETVVQFADERRNLYTWPLTEVIALIVD